MEAEAAASDLRPASGDLVTMASNNRLKLTAPGRSVVARRLHSLPAAQPERWTDEGTTAL